MKNLLIAIMLLFVGGCYENDSIDKDTLIDCERFCDADQACANYLDPEMAYANCLEVCDALVVEADGVAMREDDLRCIDGCTPDDPGVSCDETSACVNGCTPWFWFTTCDAHCRALEACDASVNVDECALGCSGLEQGQQQCLFSCDQLYAGEDTGCASHAECSAACI